VVIARAHKQEQVERDAIEQGLELPSPWQSYKLLLPAPKDSKKEAHNEELQEIWETLLEVDLEELWERLLDGAAEDETAIDADEIKHFFGGEAKRARFWINRICKLANLKHVEPPETTTFMGTLGAVQSSVDSLENEVDKCYSDFKVQGGLKQWLPSEGLNAYEEPILEATRKRNSAMILEDWQLSLVAPVSGSQKMNAALHRQEKERQKIFGICPPPAHGQLKLASEMVAAKRDQNRQSALQGTEEEGTNVQAMRYNQGHASDLGEWDNREVVVLEPGQVGEKKAGVSRFLQQKPPVRV
jgi:hypothetical protein